MSAGAKGIIMFSDPADYSAAGVQVEYNASQYLLIPASSDYTHLQPWPPH